MCRLVINVAKPAACQVISFFPLISVTARRGSERKEMAGNG